MDRFSQCITTVVITRLVLSLRSVHKCHSMPTEHTQPYSGQTQHSHKLSRLDFVVGSLGDISDYNGDDPEHDCNGTSSHVSSDGSQTVVSASASARLSYKSDLEKAQTDKTIDRSSPVSPRSPYPDKDIYRHSYRIVQHPYSLRAGFGGSRYVDDRWSSRFGLALSVLLPTIETRWSPLRPRSNFLDYIYFRSNLNSTTMRSHDQVVPPLCAFLYLFQSHLWPHLFYLLHQGSHPLRN